MNPNEQKAYEAMVKAANDTFHCKCVSCWDAVKRLSAAGLLVTPDHEAALAACEEYWRHFRRVPFVPVEGEVASVGRRSLDAKRPKERWTCDPDGIVCCDGKTVLKFYTPCAAKDARAYAADMNAKEAGR